MAENTSTRGRKPKTTVENNTKITNNSDIDINAIMQQMQTLQKQFEDAQKKNADLEDLISALKTNQTTSNNVILPKKVKVVNLLFNTLNLSTMPRGMGKVYTFDSFGDMVTMKTSDLEDILSIPAYRKQAEEGLFYICNEDVVADQDLVDEYAQIHDKKAIEMICNLQTDSCVEMFCSMNKTLQNSIATKIAERMANGESFDRNRLASIKSNTDIDIEKMSEDLIDAKKVHSKK